MTADATLVVAALGGQTLGQPGPTFADPRRRVRPGGAIAAALQAAAAASPRGSKSFAPLGATVSHRSCPRGQAGSGQDWKGPRSTGRGCGTSTMVRAAGAQTLTVVRGHWPADRATRCSSEGLCHGHWPEWALGASLVPGCAGRILPTCEQTFALDLKQAGFDRDGTT